MDKYSIPTDDLLYGLLEQCVLREQEWRRRFEREEIAHADFQINADACIREQRMLIDQLKDQIQQMAASTASPAGLSSWRGSTENVQQILEKK